MKPAARKLASSPGRPGSKPSVGAFLDEIEAEVQESFAGLWGRQRDLQERDSTAASRTLRERARIVAGTEIPAGTRIGSLDREPW